MVVPHYYKELYGNTWKATWQNRMCERQQDDVVAGKFIQAFNTGTKSAHFLAKKPMLTTKSMNDIHNLPDVPHTSSFWERREKSRKFKVYLTGTESSSSSNNESRLFCEYVGHRQQFGNLRNPYCDLDVNIRFQNKKAVRFREVTKCFWEFIGWDVRCGVYGQISIHW